MDEKEPKMKIKEEEKKPPSISYYDKDEVDNLVKSGLYNNNSPCTFRFREMDEQYKDTHKDKSKKKAVANKFLKFHVNQVDELKNRIRNKGSEVNRDSDNIKLLLKANNAIANLPKYQVATTQLYAMSPAEIRKKATTIINSTNKKEGEITHGLFDIRMGPIDSKLICPECNRNDKGCSGHFGYIELPEKIVNPLYKKEIILVLQCICPFCGDTYINQEIFDALGFSKIPKNKLLKQVAEISEKFLHKTHNHGYARIKYDKAFKGSKLCFTTEEGNTPLTYIRSPNNMEGLFEAVPPEKFKLLGLSGATHPVNFITDVIVCCPPCIRPPSIVNGKQIDHPLTERYGNILSSIIKLRDHVGNNVERNNQMDKLYDHIESIINGPVKKPGLKVPLKESGILGNLGTKKGLIRGHMMGKRVDNCGRTVAGPAFEVNQGEVIIPKYATKILLVPIKVHKYNLKEVREEFKKGVYKFMKARGISMKAAIPITEKNIKDNLPMIGDEFLRYIKTGDHVLEGRQPSLHAESILGFRAVIGEHDTTKIPSWINSPFNADFDGDELTFHVLQNVRAWAEGETVMDSKYHIMNVQSNRPMMALAYHGLMGSFLMTTSWEVQGVKNEVIIPEKRWHEAVSLLNDSYRKSSLEERLRRHHINPRSGRALFSLTLPTNFTYSGGGIEIIDGILVKGVLKKANVGLKVLSLVQILAKMYSIKEASRFINDAQKIADWFVMWSGLSIGYKDFDANRKEVIKMLKKDLNKMQVEYFNLGERPKDSIHLFFWMRALHGIVDKTKINGKKIGEKYLLINNTLNILSDEHGCGAKGSTGNTSQLTGSLGEQFIGSDIPTYKLKNKTRCLPFYPPNDVSLESMGYVVNSYMDSISPSASMFHQMASRITLIDTARNVSDIGYTHRRVEKSLEPIVINCFSFVASTDGRLFQPIFGAGLNVAKTMPVRTKRVGEKIFFCNFQDEARLLNRIYERKVLGLESPQKSSVKVKTPFELFKEKHGRYPKFSELTELNE